MKWQTLVGVWLVCGLVPAQEPAAPLGSTKPAVKKTSRIAERAESMRKSITAGRQVKAHVKVRIRLQNGNRLNGVVKDGRLIERVDGLRFVDANARDAGAGIRVWYSGGTRSYIFVPFASLKDYEVVQRLSQKQLMDLERAMQMTEKRAKERAVKAGRQAKNNANHVGSAPDTGGQDVQDQSYAQNLAELDKRSGLADLPGYTPPPGLRAVDLAGRKSKVLPPNAASTGGLPATVGSVTKPAGGSKKASAVVAKATDSVTEMKTAKQELAWAQLLLRYPPKSGWNEAKKDEIARRMNVVGALPSDFELEFVKKFGEWSKACEKNGVDPNVGAIKPVETKRDRRRANRARIRGH